MLSAGKPGHGVHVGQVPLASHELCRCQEPEQCICFVAADGIGMALIRIQEQLQQLSDHSSFLIMAVACCDLGSSTTALEPAVTKVTEQAAASLPFCDLGAPFRKAQPRGFSRVSNSKAIKLLLINAFLLN